MIVDGIFDYPSAVGIADLPGNDFLVAPRGAVQADNAATIYMHELGHNLSLGHGGGDGVNCKPNYLSIMNYQQETSASDVPGAYPLDYSRAALPTLNESALNEPAGIGGPAGRVAVYSAGGKSRGAPADGPIDWNVNGRSTDTGVAEDINHFDDEFCRTSPGQMLKGHDDWHHLLYDFRNLPLAADYARLDLPPVRSPLPRTSSPTATTTRTACRMWWTTAPPWPTATSATVTMTGSATRATRQRPAHHHDDPADPRGDVSAAAARHCRVLLCRRTGRFRCRDVRRGHPQRRTTGHRDGGHPHLHGPDQRQRRALGQ